MSEVSRKLEKLRRLMQYHHIPALRLKGVDWFAWATAGGNSVVIFTSEIGIGEVFLTLQKAWVLTNEIEKARLASEEISPDFEIKAFPWADSNSTQQFILAELKGQRCFSDRPLESETALPSEFQNLKMILEKEEISRYREVGRLSAEAMSEAIRMAQPDWTEYRLAAEGAKSLWQRGLEPTLVMVGCEKRIQTHRHPIAGPAKLGEGAMMVFCARRFGLYANLTRFVFFRHLTAQEKRNFALLAEIEASVFSACREGQSLNQIYHEFAQAYKKYDLPEEIFKHHQGGPTGYLSREKVASWDSDPSWKLKTGMALAWNPSLPGAKIEDTVLMTENGIENLTFDSSWPNQKIHNRFRPDVLIKN